MRLRDPLGYATVLAAAAVLICQLFIPPHVGLANNGDFGKLTGSFSLHAPAEDEFKYANLKWSFDQKYYWRSGYYSSEELLVALAVGLNKLFTSSTTFDIRWMGLLHGLLFLLPISLLQPLLAEMPNLRRTLISAAVIFVFADLEYTCIFNSFYMDAAAYLSLLLAVILYLRAARLRRWGDSIGLIAAAVCLVLSKPQHAVLTIWIAAVFLFFGASLWPLHGRALSFISAAIVIASSAFGFGSTPPGQTPHGYYDVIFLQILPHSTDVSGDLKALGLDASYQRWIGTHAYSPAGAMGDPAFVRAFSERTSYSRLGWYFLTHPRDAYLALEVSLDQAGRQRPPMGNFDRSRGLPPYAESHAFSLWSDIKARWFDQHGGRYLAWCILISVLFCAMATATRRSMPAACLPGAYALIAMAVTSLLEASLGDAAEVARHHTIASTLVDLELVLTLGLAACYLPLRNGGK